ncbi:MAG TPA: TlpA disulfide reductase family protein [Gemmataceae bacterium]|nr:TlpA disulfide reductase family protein [Gemmataceae bacterium]
MRRVLLIGLVLFAGGLGLSSGDEPAAPASPLGRKLTKLQKQFETDKQPLKKKLADAKDPEDKKQITFQIKELHALTASDALDLAEDGKKTEDGLDAAVFVLKLLGEYQITGQDMDKAAAIVLENHIDSPKIAPALEHMVGCGPTGLLFLETVVEKATKPDVQALALYYNALAMDAKATAAEGPSGDDVKIANFRGRAADMMERAAKLAPDAKVGTDTLAKAVATEVASLRIGPGNPVPDVEGTDLDGKKVKLSSYRGKVVLFDFWATWCGPCKAMIPHERELTEKLKDMPFAILSVSVDDEKKELAEFLGTEKMPWAHWWDGPKGPVVKLFRVKSFPTLFLIDAKGVVRNKWVGSPGNEALDKAVNELVAEAQKK